MESLHLIFIFFYILLFESPSVTFKPRSRRMVFFFFFGFSNLEGKVKSAISLFGKKWHNVTSLN